MEEFVEGLLSPEHFARQLYADADLEALLLAAPDVVAAQRTVARDHVPRHVVGWHDHQMHAVPAVERELPHREREVRRDLAVGGRLQLSLAVIGAQVPFALVQAEHGAVVVHPDDQVSVPGVLAAGCVGERNEVFEHIVGLCDHPFVVVLFVFAFEGNGVEEVL
nr:hypothetical protein [Deinococcus peraridilitoris]